jgi:hypothetical protein
MQHGSKRNFYTAIRHSTTNLYSRKLSLLSLSAIVCAFSFFYLPMIKTYFFIDDLEWIWASSNTRWKDIFFDPLIARGMSPFFTPMLGASFKVDWILFGIHPAGYSVHGLISLAAASIAFYLFIRLYATETISLAGVLLFLLNPSTIVITSWFAARHYLEGLFFALVSLYLFVGAERKGKISILSGFFYLIASLNKETYVVLPAIAFLISNGNLSKRIRNTIPFWMGLCVYVLWRFAIVGGIGGYISMQSFRLDATLLWTVIKLFSFHWFGDYFMLGYLFLFAAFLFSLKKIRLFLIFLVLLIPILPLGAKLIGEHYSGRYLFHISVFMICVVCLFIQYRTAEKKIIYKGAALLVYLFIAVLFVKQDIQLSDTIQRERLKIKEAAMALLYSDKPYVKSDQPLPLDTFYYPLQKIYHEYFGTDIRAHLVPTEDSLKYCDAERLKEIRAAGIDIPYDDIIAASNKLRKGPIVVKMIIDNYKFKWDLGPDKHASYAFVLGPATGLYYGKGPIPPSGSVLIGRNPKDEITTFYVRILSQSGDKEEVVSPEFVMKFPGTQTIEYQSEQIDKL